MRRCVRTPTRLVQEEGCRALRNLACDAPANRTAIAAAGGVECVTAAMRTHADAADMQEDGCLALGNLARNHPANQTAIAAAGGIECVIAAMRTHADSEKVQQKGCFVFSFLVDHQKAAVAASGAPALVASAARRFGPNANVQKYAREVAHVVKQGARLM